MVEILQAFGRAVVAMIAGALVMIATAFVVDSRTGTTFQFIRTMLDAADLRLIFLAITPLTAYVVGVIVSAGSNLAFSRLVPIRNDDLLIVSEIESLEKPQLLKETLDFINIRRTLVSCVGPLICFGIGLAFDNPQWQDKVWILRAIGSSLATTGIAALIFAWRLSHRLDKSLNSLRRESGPS